MVMMMVMMFCELTLLAKHLCFKSTATVLDVVLSNVKKLVVTSFGFSIGSRENCTAC